MLTVAPLAFLESHFDRLIQCDHVISFFLAKYAEESCSLLMAPAFEPCHHAVSPTPYVKNCRFDVCSCSSGKDCLCSAIANYAAACARKSILVQWRQPDFCCKCNGCQTLILSSSWRNFFWQHWMKDVEWDARFSLWQMMMVNLSSTLVRKQKLFSGSAQQWGREVVIWHSSVELLPGFPFSATHLETFWMSQGRNLPSDL